MYMSNRSRKLVALYLIVALLIPSTIRCNDDHEYVRQVLEENEDHFDEDSMYHDDDYVERIRRQKEEQRRQQEEEQERLERERAERVRLEREEAFERELTKMNEDQKKLAKQQKKKDAQIVRKVLKANGRGDLYGVLGLRNAQLEIPARDFRIGKVGFTFPGIVFFRVTQSDIKRAFRDLAKRVHPDKNRDGRAVEAFIAVENAASVLTDESQRKVYDQRLSELRQERRDTAGRYARGAVDKSLSISGGILTIVRKLLGPFFFPLMIITVLVV